MKLTTRLIAGWPKLAWVATFPDGASDVCVYHGPMVEVGDGWCAEAAWDDDFGSGGFDRTDLVFGSGVRLREGRVVFVSSASGVDRLWHCGHGGARYVSNSLPALLACSSLSLRDDYDRYPADMGSIETDGLLRYKRTIPTSGSPVSILYFANLAYDGRALEEVDKPDRTPHFATFGDYFGFLTATAARIGENIGSPARKFRIVPFVGVSSGYDSGACAVVAARAGCTQAATLRKATSYWRGSDSGEPIARRLGMSCPVCERGPRSYAHEETVWAASGLSAGFNLTSLPYPEPLALFFTGSYGDKVWDRAPHDLSNPVGDRDHFLGEFRLVQGLLQSVVPWWGIRRAQEVNALGAKPEMGPWTLHVAYDRPVARRVLEEAGIARGTFGIRKKNTSSNTRFLWPYSSKAQESFASYLRERGVYVPPLWLVAVFRRLAHFDGLLYNNLTKRLGRKRWRRPWERLRGPNLLLQWANHELTKVYKRGLEETGAAADRVSGRELGPRRGAGSLAT